MLQRRNRFQQKLRKALRREQSVAKKGLPIDMAGIMELCREARSMKGVMLLMEADRAEKWCKDHVTSQKMAVKLQQNFRGFADRMFAKGLKGAREGRWR